ncbi:MAG: hypothetical protein H6650_14930 [Ardenticatenales bacterium]|nr:hypothetical protein [Ardenticatenales bacterium]
MQANEEAAQDVEIAVSAVHDWNTRKKDRYQPFHIRSAWQRLHDTLWQVAPDKTADDSSERIRL